MDAVSIVITYGQRSANQSSRYPFLQHGGKKKSLKEKEGEMKA